MMQVDASGKRTAGSFGATTKEMLDTIDDVRVVLAGLHDDSSAVEGSLYEQLLAELPQFVACGPQSSGKSATLRRISGVSLPEKATACTRIATLVQVRREEEEKVTVQLVGPDGKEISIDETTAERVKDLVSKHQETAIARSPGKSFVDDHTIIVRVTGPNKPNITLVDLPGFHTDDDADTSVVNELVGRYIGMKGTLALHVIKGDQDYGGLLGNDFMRKHSTVPRITVLTHCDKLTNDPKAVSLLKHTLDKTSENSSQTYAINGEVGIEEKDRAAELKSLQHLAAMDPRIEVGVEALSAHVEGRMSDHLHKQFPKALDKLLATLQHTSTRLAAIQEKSPAEVLYHMALKIKDNDQSLRRKALNAIRKIAEEMCRKIKNFQLQPLSPGVEDGLRSIDTFDDLEEGQNLYVPIPSIFPSTFPSFIPSTSTSTSTSISTGNTEVMITEIITKGGITSISWQTLDGRKTGTTKKTDAFAAGSCPKSIVEDIRHLGENRGMRNLVHVDRQPILEAYAAAFAAHYADVMREAKIEMLAVVKKRFDSAFRTGVEPTALPVASHLRGDMMRRFHDADERGDKCIEAIESYNNTSDLVFTPNTHYLNQLIKKMVEADGSMATDDGGARHIYHNVRAYLKVQVKLVSEVACRELTRAILLGSDADFEALMKDSPYKPECSALIKEPATITRERHSLRNREKVLKEAIEKMKII